MKSLVLDDGNRGNLNQALGIAESLPEAAPEVIRVGDLSTPRRALLLLAANLSPLLPLAAGRFLLRRLAGLDLPSGYPGPQAIISAGGRLAPVNLLLARSRLALSVQVLYPDFLPAGRFDLLVIPEHDLWRRGLARPPKNALVTRGAVNRVRPQPARPPAPDGRRTLACLIGGDDRNYRLDTQYAGELGRRLLELARTGRYRILLTTSRRTDPESEKKLAALLAEAGPEAQVVGYHASRANPVREFLAEADLVLATEDSINMLSEAAASNRPTLALRVGRRRPGRLVFDRTLESMETAGHLRIVGLEDLEAERLEKVLTGFRPRLLAETERAAAAVVRRLAETQVRVIGTSCLGDNLILSPAYRVLRENFPLARLEIVTDRRSAGFFEGHPYFERILYWQKQAPREEKIAFLKELRQRPADYLFDFRCSLLGLLAGGRRRALFLLSQGRPRPGEHETDRWRRLLGYFLPGPAAPAFDFPALRAEADWLKETLAGRGLAEKGFIILNPGGRWEKKRWPPEEFAALADLAWDRWQLPAVLVGDCDETGLAAAVEKSVRRARTVNLAGATTIRQLAALLAAGRCLVSNDTGTVHLASAAGCPQVVLFGPGDWRRYGPYGVPFAIVASGLRCSPCLRETCPRDFECWQKITPERVLAAAEPFCAG